MRWIELFRRLCLFFRGEIFISREMWHRLLDALKERSDGRFESGAFLLGIRKGRKRFVKMFVLYDDLAPGCLNAGYIRFDGATFSKLWEICRAEKMGVVADIHVHPGLAYLSGADSENPMIREKGHCALIIPDYARVRPHLNDVGFYQYLGNGNWRKMTKWNLRIQGR